VLAMSDDRPASVADIVVEELRKKEINGPIRLPKRDFFTRGQKLKVKDPWHILSGVFGAGEFKVKTQRIGSGRSVSEVGGPSARHRGRPAFDAVVGARTAGCQQRDRRCPEGRATRG
jgi:hypothetical protein